MSTRSAGSTCRTTLPLVAAIILVVAGLAGIAPAQASLTTMVEVTGSVSRIADHTSGSGLVLNASGRLVAIPPNLAGDVAAGDVVRARLAVNTLSSSSTAAVAAASSGNGRVVSVTTLASNAAPLDLASQINGQHTMTLAPVYVASANPLASLPPAWKLEAMAQSAASYYASQTGGALTFTVKVLPWKPIASYADCFTTAFNSAAAAHGISAPSNTGNAHVVVVMPEACGSSPGLAFISGRIIWVRGGFNTPSLLSHELGHNLGLQHSNLQSCSSGTATVIRGGTCTDSEYDDRSDVMGYSQLGGVVPPLNGPQADRLGLLAGADIQPGESTTTLQPIYAHTGTRALRIPADDGHTLYVQYAPRVSDLGTPARQRYAGVQVRDMSPDSPKPELLQAGAPWSTSSDDLIPLAPYAATVLPGTGYAVSVGALGSTAVIRTRPVSSDSTDPAPAGPLAPAAGGSVLTSSVTLTWAPGSDAESGIAGERIVLSSPDLPNDLSIPVAPGTGSVTVPSLTDGMYSWKIISINGVGRTATSASHDFTLDTYAPGASDFTSTWDPCLSGQQSVTWFGVADPQGPVNYRLVVDGSTVTTTASEGAVVDASSLGSGQHVARLDVIDVHGNTSSSSDQQWQVDLAAPSNPIGLQLLPSDTPGDWVVSYTQEGADDVGPVSTDVLVNGTSAATLSPGATSTISLSDGDVVTARSADGCGRASTSTPLVRGVADATPPSAPAITQPTAGTYASPSSSTLDVTWTPANDAESGIIGYNIVADGNVIFTVDASRSSATLSYYFSGTSTSIVVQAVNGQGLTSDSGARVISIDDAAPTAPVITSPADASDVASSSVAVTWKAATDSGGSGIAGYRILLNGDVVKTVAAGTLSTSVPEPAGYYQIVVQAFDLAGNVTDSDSVAIGLTSPTTGGGTVAVAGPSPIGVGSYEYTVTADSNAPIAAGREAVLTFQRTGSSDVRDLAHVWLGPSSGHLVGTARLLMDAPGTLGVEVIEPDGYLSPTSSLPVTVTGPSPTISSAPKIVGTVKVAYKVSCSVGFSNATGVTYRWLSNGTAISGASASTFSISAGYAGRQLACRAAAKNMFGTTTTTSPSIKVALGSFKLVKAPYLSGTVKVGRYAYAHSGSWSPAPTSTGYQWLRNGAAIRGATKSKYRMTSADRGRYLSLKVTVKMSGYATASKVSKRFKVA